MRFRKITKKIKELTNVKEEKKQEIQRINKNKEIMTKTYKIFRIAQFQLEQLGIKMDDIDSS